jgi:tetratricopeptide (TPR) repeat protein
MTTLMLIIRNFTTFIVVCLCGITSVWTIRLAWADHLSARETIPDRQRAVQLTPGNVKYWISLANLQQQYGVSAIPAYNQATQSSPLNAEAWIGLGLEYELAGDYSLAEKSLLQAVEVSREFVPRWTLASYYFRRNDSAHFWSWARQALEIGSGDLIPIFRMAWAVNNGADPFEKGFIPDRRLVYSQYVSWLVSEKRLSAAGAAAKYLATIAEIEDLQPLLYFVNGHLAESAFEPASAIWNRMVDRHVIASSKVPPPDGIVDSSFTREPLNLGFEWRVSQLDGVTFRWESPGVRIDFSGLQPESCELLSQYVRLDENVAYRLNYSFESSNLNEDSGLYFRLAAGQNSSDLMNQAVSISRQGPSRDVIDFSTPSGFKGGRLVLVYRRTAGTTRISGWLRLKHIGIRPAR